MGDHMWVWVFVHAKFCSHCGTRLMSDADYEKTQKLGYWVAKQNELERQAVLAAKKSYVNDKAIASLDPRFMASVDENGVLVHVGGAAKRPRTEGTASSGYQLLASG